MTLEQIDEIKHDLQELCKKHNIAIHSEEESVCIAVFTPGPFPNDIVPQPNYFMFYFVSADKLMLDVPRIL